MISEESRFKFPILKIEGLYSEPNNTAGVLTFDYYIIVSGNKIKVSESIFKKMDNILVEGRRGIIESSEEEV